MRRLTADDGAIAVMVAVLLVVLLGVAALAVDVGNLYWERRQLQNGADAAALAAAQDLAAGASDAVALATARAYADDNDFRGAHVADGSYQRPTANSVRVRTETGSVAAPGTLSAFLAGAIGVDAYATGAAATASWGPVGGGITIPITICEDAWNHLTAGALPSGPPAHVLRIGVPPGHLDEDLDCSNPGAGDVPPGGFGFLDADGNCMATVDGGAWAGGESGNTPDITGGSSCSPDQFYETLFDLVNEDGSVLIPIFDEYADAGGSASYHIIGFGGFHLEGYAINGGPQPSNPAHGRTYQWSGSCPGSASCLLGYFTEFVALDALPGVGGAGPDYGAYVIALID